METILIDACENGNLELVKYLVEEKKMDVNAKFDDGQTLLLWANKYSFDKEIIDYLISVR